MVGNLFRFICQYFSIYPGFVFTVMINTGVYKNPLEPPFQCYFSFRMSRFIKLVNIFKQFYKSFIHNFFRFLYVVLITVTDFHGIALKKLIQLFLAAAVIVPAAGYHCAYLLVARNQIGRSSFYSCRDNERKLPHLLKNYVNE